MRRSKERGFNVTNEIRRTSGKFAGRVARIFKSLPKPLEWQSFYRHDVPILMDISEEVRVGNNPHHRLSLAYTAISPKHGEPDAKEPNPWESFDAHF